MGIVIITDLRFADDIDGVTGEDDELTKFVQYFDTAAAKFGMETNAEKNHTTGNSRRQVKKVRPKKR